MLFLILILLFTLLLLVLNVMNRNKPYTPKMRLANKITYSIWFLTFVFMMVNMGDGNRMQFQAVFIFMGTTILTVLVLIVIQLLRYRLNQVKRDPRQNKI